MLKKKVKHTFFEYQSFAGGVIILQPSGLDVQSQLFSKGSHKKQLTL